uniref:C-type lectin domain-containing protein n=1 Tax=Steinernema glaseri TaxID=37863 RepID=A0A1I7YFS2_9BILA
MIIETTYFSEAELMHSISEKTTLLPWLQTLYCAARCVLCAIYVALMPPGQVSCFMILRLVVVLCLSPAVVVGGDVFVRDLPKGTVFDGEITHVMRAKEHPRECVKEWYSEPVVALNFLPNSSMCHGFEKIKGTKGAESANDTGYLLDRGSVDVCTRDPMLAVNETIRRGGLKAQRRCRVGWLAVTVGQQTHCYRTIPPLELKASGVLMSNFVSVCKKIHPFSEAASIHSSDENKALQSLKHECLMIGMRVKSGQSNCEYSSWEWVDGMPMDFTAWNPTIYRSCQGTNMWNFVRYCNGS